MSLKRARPVPGLDLPLPNLHLLIDRDHLHHLEDESRLGERLFEGSPRLRREGRRVLHQRDLVVILVAKRQVAVRLRPRKALTQPYRDRFAIDDREETAVASVSEREFCAAFEL